MKDKERIARIEECVTRIDRNITTLFDLVNNKFYPAEQLGKANAENIKWLTWGFRTIAAGMLGSVLYIVAKIKGS